MILKDNLKLYKIVGCAMKVHSTLGCGFLEAAYGDALEVEFKKADIPYVREDNVSINYDGEVLPTRWRADFTCYDHEFIVELKAIKNLTKIEKAQVVHYLNATKIPYAILINFGQLRLQYKVLHISKT